MNTAIALNETAPAKPAAVSLSVWENKAVAAWSSPKVADRLGDQQAETGMLRMITVKLQDAARKSGVGAALQGDELGRIAKDILDVLPEFPRLRMAEISLIFDLGAIGRFGDFAGHSLNARTFRAWVLAYETQTRNELIARQLEAERAAEERIEAENVRKYAEGGDLLLARDFIQAFADMAANRKQMPDAEFSAASVPGNIDTSGIWFKKFKETGILEKVLPLTVEEKKEIFARQLGVVNEMNRQLGAFWTDEQKRTRARIMSESVWFRRAIAHLVNIGTTPEDFERILINAKMIRSTWRDELKRLAA